MSERIERLGFIMAAIIQVAAVIWWISSLSSTVESQRVLAITLDSKVDNLTERTIRIEEKLRAFEKDVDINTKILLKIEDRLDENNL